MAQREYKVVGAAAFDGHAPGDKFKADLDERREARLIRNGVIKRVGAKAPAAAKEEEPGLIEEQRQAAEEEE